MDRKSGKSLSPIGFLNAVESPELGLLGGYLAVSPEGRPLEFRCTTPVRASRAQEILYGATLAEHLHSDVLGLPLLTGARLRPPLILAPDAKWRQLAWHVDAQIVQLAQVESSATRDMHLPDEDGGRTIGPFQVQQIDGQPLEPAALDSLDHLSRYVRLDEPFERISLALEEVLLTSAASVSGADTHDAAA